MEKMNRYYVNKIGLCAYAEYFQIKPLKRWLAWLRKRGIGCIYLYASRDIEVIEKALQREIFNGQVVVFSIKLKDVFSSLDTVYNDCLSRVRYMCKYLAILNPGDYIESLPGGSFEALADSVFVSGASFVEFDSPGDEKRYLINPLLVKAFKNRQLLSASGYRGRREAGLSIGKKRAKSVALLSHIMARNGAPLALLEAARILKEAGYEIDVYSVTKGPLIEEFGKLGISVTVDPFLHSVPLARQPWYHAYDLFLVNTAVMVNCFTQPLNDADAIWWLHESASSLKWCGIDENILAGLKMEKITVLGVSEVAVRDFHSLRPKLPAKGILTLGIGDRFKGRNRNYKDKPFVYMLCGTWEKKKGQDIFLKAISELSENERKECEFWIVGGKGKTTRAEDMEIIYSMSAAYPEVKLIDFQPHERILEMYEMVDAVVIPSREETLSIVAIEAMMMELPCIVSDSTGISDFIIDRKSGLKFPAGEIGKLRDAMKYLLENKERAISLGKESRKIYEHNFRKDIFAGNLLELVERLV